MKSINKFYFLMMLTLSLVGCGGGGGASNSTTPPSVSAAKTCDGVCFSAEATE